MPVSEVKFDGLSENLGIDAADGRWRLRPNACRLSTTTPRRKFPAVMDVASSLPVEIIRRILGMSLVAVDEKYVRLEALATVCHQWRDVVLDDGMLWNDVRVTTAVTNSQVSTLLRRSARCTLSVDIKGDLDSRSLACAELAIGQYQRVVYLAIGLDTDAWPLEITRRLTDASLWPELQYLTLAHSPKRVYQNAILNLRVNAPHLHSIVLYRIDVPNWSTLGEALPNLQNLTVEWITSAASLLPVLPRFSALRCLRLLIADWHETLDADLPPSFSLPHLHSLEIDAHGLRADILPAIVSSNSPNLASLSVTFDAIDLRQGRIELSAPALTDLYIEYAKVSSTDRPIPIYFRVVPRALIDLYLTGVTGDIAAMASPSLRKLYLAYTDVDVERLSSALSHCQHVERLEFTGLRCTSAVALHPPAIAVLPRLTYAVLTGRVGEPLDEEILRLFVRLLPPTIVQMYISGKPCPSGDDLRSVLEDIERLAAPTNLWLGIIEGRYFTLTELVRDYKRMFAIESSADYLEILLSRPAFCAHIRHLEVEVAPATQILSHCAGSLPLLEELRIFYPAEYNHPANKDQIRRSLEDLVESVPSPITCPKFKTLRLHLYDNSIPKQARSPVALGRALVSLFLSQEDEVCFELSDGLRWLGE